MDDKKPIMVRVRDVDLHRMAFLIDSLSFQRVHDTRQNWDIVLRKVLLDTFFNVILLPEWVGCRCW